VAAARRRLLFDWGLDSRQRRAAWREWISVWGFTVKKISPSTRSTPIPASIGQYPVLQYQYRLNPNQYSASLGNRQGTGIGIGIGYWYRQDPIVLGIG